MRMFIFMMMTFLALPLQAAESWILSAKDAVLQLPSATVLDTRGATGFGMSHVNGSTRVTWQQFSKTTAKDRGELLSDKALKSAIEAVGVRNDRKVIVVGDPTAWGEDGRIVWMLRAAGHQSAFLVDGGYPALKAAGAPTGPGFSASPKDGDFSIRWNTKLTATAQDVRAAVASDTVVLDVREKREYDGKTPYGESRGGHVPGAQHLWFKDLMDKNGMLLPQAQIKKRLLSVGITPTTPVIAYCTGGIRSAWLVAVLDSIGYQASNYAGSMWQWSEQPAKDFPLE